MFLCVLSIVCMPLLLLLLDKALQNSLLCVLFGSFWVCYWMVVCIQGIIYVSCLLDSTFFRIFQNLFMSVLPLCVMLLIDFSIASWAVGPWHNHAFFYEVICCETYLNFHQNVLYNILFRALKMRILYISFGILLCRVATIRFTVQYRSQGPPCPSLA